MKIALRCSFIFFVLLVACSQDPLQVPNYGDGGTDAVDDTQIMPDLTDPDARTDFVLPDWGRPDLEMDACLAQVEVCNNVDDNCNGKVDEGFEDKKLNDARFCEDCKGCQFLLKEHAIPACQAGKCVIGSCMSGWIDGNKDVSDGCEYECTPSGVEVCDGVDNDCNGTPDDGVTLGQQICKTLGACNNATAECKGAQGWVCQYPADVELQPCIQDEDCGSANKCVGNVCPNLVIVDEVRCDGLDGDCDGLADDPWVNAAEPLGGECKLLANKPCTPGGGECDDAAGSECVANLCTDKKGVCRDVGVISCKADASGSECTLKTAGIAPSAELCNGKDDDCNGTVDDDVTDEQWVTIGGLSIFKYEASRPDGTDTDAGIITNGRACSVAGRLPWANISRVEAQQACQNAGGRLCTPAEWISACVSAAGTAYPYGATFNPSTCNGRAYDAAVDEVLPTDEPASCVSDWGAAGQVLNMSGNVKEWVKVGSNYQTKGGAFDTPSITGFGAGLSCQYELPVPATTLRLPTLGFRCCK